MNFSSDQHTDKLVPYSVGFLKQVPSGKDTVKFTPAGSGVLVEIEGIKGILTAAHVYKELKKGPAAMLFTVTDRHIKARPLRFSTEQLDTVVLHNYGDGSVGPDIAFIRVPFEIAGDLDSSNLFCNFAVRGERAKNGINQPELIYELIIGVVAENTHFKSEKNGVRTDTHVMSIADGKSSGIRTVGENLEVFDFKVLHDENVKRPSSYGGLSGSAIWAIGDSDVATDDLIYGIAFYESEADADGNRLLICNGPKTIYQSLAKAVAEKYLV